MRISKYARPVSIVTLSLIAAWFAVYAGLVFAGEMKSWETAGPYYHLWYALYGSTRAWACHLLAVFLSAFVLTPLFKSRWVVIPLSAAVGLAVVWGIVMLENGEHVYLGASSYWREDVSQVFYVSVLWEFPGEFFFSTLVAWALPIAIAWVTVKWRSRKPVRPPDDGDESTTRGVDEHV